MMLRQLTSAQLTELESMWTLEGGWGSYKEDWRAAKSDTIQANINKGKDSRPAKVTDMIMNPDVQHGVQEQLANQEAQTKEVRRKLKDLSRRNPAKDSNKTLKDRDKFKKKRQQ